MLPDSSTPAGSSDSSQPSDAEAIRLRVDALRQAISARAHCPVALTIHENRVQYVTFRSDGAVCRLRLHRAFLEAPEDVLAALAEWIRQPRAGAPAGVRTFVRTMSRRNAAAPSTRRVHLRAIGFVHDLRPLFERVNRECFNRQITAAITWGNNSEARRVRRRRLGSYSFLHNVIRIHPVLDRRDVPLYYLAYVLHHEMLHSLQPKGMRRPHGPQFRSAIRQCPQYRRARAWEKAHLKLLGLPPDPRDRRENCP